MRRVLQCILTILFLCKCIAAYNILVLEAVNHPALDSVAKGVESLFKGQVRIISGQGNPALMSQIVTNALVEKCDAVVTIGTTPTQIAFRILKGRIPLVFGSVTSPSCVALSFKDTNTTGVSNYVASESQFKFFKEIQPKLKKLGIIYNPGEANSVFLRKDMEGAAKEYGITLVLQTATKTADIPQALASIEDKVDAIYINNDNTALSAINCIIQECKKRKIPVYVSDTDLVDKGCVAALGSEQFELGQQCGRMLEKILSKKVSTNDIPVESPNKIQKFFNDSVAEELDLKGNTAKMAKTSGKEISTILGIGLIYGLVAIGIYLTFRTINFADLTCDGSFVLGAAVFAVTVQSGFSVLLGLLLSFLAGGIAGLCSGILNVKFKISDLLSGIIVAFMLYSINLRVMGNFPNIAFTGADISFSLSELFFIILAISGFLVYMLFTDFGLALRAIGYNKLYATVSGISISLMTYIGLALSNALVGLGGALFTQYQGFCDISQGAGTLVTGLASVVIGEKVLRCEKIPFMILSCLVGSILYRTFIALALRCSFLNISPQDLNLITGLMIIGIMILNRRDKNARN